MSTVPDSTNTSGSGLTTGLKVTSVVLALGLVVQAWLGSTSFFENEPDFTTMHEMLGNILFLVAAAQIALAFFAMQRGLATKALLIVSILLIASIVAQLGLGYSGRESLTARTWHIPNGVLLMGLCTYSAVLAWMRPGDRA